MSLFSAKPDRLAMPDCYNSASSDPITFRAPPTYGGIDTAMKQIKGRQSFPARSHRAGILRKLCLAMAYL
jgi:hypothetical protein